LNAGGVAEEVAINRKTGAQRSTMDQPAGRLLLALIDGIERLPFRLVANCNSLKSQLSQVTS
jgi:hypothetical protein